MKRLLPPLILAAFGAAFFKASRHHIEPGFALRQEGAASNAAAEISSRFASSTQNIQTHAASLIELKDGRIRAFWFAGSREGARDVAIRSAVFDPAQGQWGAEQIIATRETTMRGLQRYIAKLGNPVPARAADGTLWLYYVTVSVGGWAGSSITAIKSDDEGMTWGAPQRLVTSPFINISTLVKGAPFLYADGTLGLPVYHEFISKFGELLRLDGGRVLDKQRLTAAGNGALQPVVMMKNASEAQVLMRYSGGGEHRAVTVSTHDGGTSWSAPAKSVLPNPDAAISALALPDGKLLAVLNNQESGRDALSLMASMDGGASWKSVYQLEDQRKTAPDEAAYQKTVEGLVKESDAGAAASASAYVESAKRQVCPDHSCRYEFSYPYLIRTQRGDFHLVYTWNRSFIKHVAFTRGWLEQKLKEAQP